MEFLERMEELQSCILEFLDDEDCNKQKFDNFISLFLQQTPYDKDELNSFFQLISNLTKNHRISFLYDKIKKILNFLKNQIKQTFSNSEIFDFYKNNKLVLLILIEEEILSVDDYIITKIKDIPSYEKYFYPEIQKYELNLFYKETTKDFEEKRHNGVNDSYICELIRNDDSIKFIDLYNRNAFSLLDTITPSIFETNSYLLKKQPTLIEYTTFNGSIDIFIFLKTKNVKLTKSLWLYAIHGRNPEIIHILEENNTEFNDQIYDKCLKESIKCFHNDFALYYKNNFLKKSIDIKSNFFNNDISYGFQYYNFDFIPKELEEPICFKDCINITQIDIPLSIKSIGESAFSGCTNLKEISIPFSVKSIEDFAFSGCINLRQILIPSSVDFIGEYSFKDCISLTKIVIPSEINHIGHFNFSKCSLLSEFIIPSSVTSIEDKTFYQCSSLTKIDIPSSVTYIGKYAFFQCSSLKDIIIPPHVTTIEENTFNGCSSLYKINIPPSVTSISFGAFFECTSLEEIFIPSSVNTIEFYAFKGCSSLKTISIDPSSYNKAILFYLLNSLMEYGKFPKKFLEYTMNFNINYIYQNPICLKLIVLGTFVGKTCIINRFLSNEFRENTFGNVDCVIYPDTFYIDGREVSLNIIDTSGCCAYRPLNRLFYHSLNAAIVAFDFSEESSIEEAIYYIKDILEKIGHIPMVLLGNKCELEHKVSNDKIQEIETKYNIKFFEVSALKNINIKEAFLYAYSEAFHYYLYSEYKNPTHINEFISNEGDKKSFC